MSTLYALLWKEGREILPKVLVAVALAAVVCLMRNNADFSRSYVASFEELIIGGLVVMAIVLGMDAIARERSTGTLSFLLDKPVAGATVLAVKFLLGLGGLLLVVLVAWATVYIDLASIEVEREYLAYKLVTVQSIDYASMVALSFTQFSLLYALVFIGSVVTDHPFKGLAVGIALAVVLGVFLTGPATAILPILNRYPLVAIGLDDQGHLVRLATDSARFWVKVLANLGLTAAALVVAVVLLHRYREAMLSWRTVAIGWGAIIAVVFAIFYGGPLVNQRKPVGVLKAPDKQYYGDLAIQDELAYMTTGQIGIAIADLSNPQQMRLLGSTRPESHELWKGGNAICVVDSLAYLVGWRKGLPSDSLGVVVFDVSDPAAPALKGSRMFAAIKRKRFRYHQYWGAIDGGLLLVRERGYALVAEAFTLDAEGMPVVGGERVIMPISDPVDDAHRWKHRCHVSVRGSRAYIGTESELVVIDVADAHTLRETGRQTLESFRPQSYYDPRLVATYGDKLYVERSWPYELVEFDISNPDQPREVGYLPLPRSDDIRSLRIVDGVAYSLGYGLGKRSSDLRVKAWTIAEYGALIESFSFESDRSIGALSVANGYLYATWGGALLAYRLD
ncbi:MAG: ABC transporter permease subunit [Candidatus Latescibacteria bacterium]|nr:ABC transporter permease subunit [Candidatus Latescibacterota bacterium]